MTVATCRPNVSPDGSAALAAGQPGLRAFVADQIRLARPDIAAGGLIALLDGPIFAIVTKQQTSASARAIMAAQLAYVFG